MTEEIILDPQTITHVKAASDAGQAFAKAIDEGTSLSVLVEHALTEYLTTQGDTR